MSRVFLCSTTWGVCFFKCLSSSSLPVFLSHLLHMSHKKIRFLDSSIVQDQIGRKSERLDGEFCMAFRMASTRPSLSSVWMEILLFQTVLTGTLGFNEVGCRVYLKDWISDRGHCSVTCWQVSEFLERERDGETHREREKLRGRHPRRDAETQTRGGGEIERDGEWSAMCFCIWRRLKVRWFNIDVPGIWQHLTIEAALGFSITLTTPSAWIRIELVVIVADWKGCHCILLEVLLSPKTLFAWMSVLLEMGRRVLMVVTISVNQLLLLFQVDGGDWTSTRNDKSLFVCNFFFRPLLLSSPSLQEVPSWGKPPGLTRLERHCTICLLRRNEASGSNVAATRAWWLTCFAIQRCTLLEVCLTVVSCVCCCCCSTWPHLLMDSSSAAAAADWNLDHVSIVVRLLVSHKTLWCIQIWCWPFILIVTREWTFLTIIDCWNQTSGSSVLMPLLLVPRDGVFAQLEVLFFLSSVGTLESCAVLWDCDGEFDSGLAEWFAQGEERDLRCACRCRMGSPAF